MISTIQPLHVGNALRLFLEPVDGAVRWKVLRKGNGSFSGYDDAEAIVAYEGDERVIVDVAHLQNEVMQFYCPFYQLLDGSWEAGPVASGTPAATYEDMTTDVLTFVRDRLEAALQVEVLRGKFRTDLGYIQVYSAPPQMDQNLVFPLVTVHLDSEEPGDRFIGEELVGDEFDAIGFDVQESEGWLADVRLAIIGWTLNPDQRIELRKAIRRIIIANLPVFAAQGWQQVKLSQQDVDAVNGEYPAQLYQVMNTFSCLAPARVAGTVPAIREVSVRSTNG